jgi:hypothetical protein
MKPLFTCVSSLRQRAFALFHRTHQLNADSAERQKRWNEVIAEHQKPVEQHQAASTASTGRPE